MSDHGAGLNCARGRQRQEMCCHLVIQYKDKVCQLLAGGLLTVLHLFVGISEDRSRLVFLQPL